MASGIGDLSPRPPRDAVVWVSFQGGKNWPPRAAYETQGCGLENAMHAASCDEAAQPTDSPRGARSDSPNRQKYWLCASIMVSIAVRVLVLELQSS